MDGTAVSAGAGRGWVLRGILVALALMAIAATLQQYSAWRRHRAELEGLVAEAGLGERVPSLARDVRREAAAADSDLAVARALVHDVLDLRELDAASREAAVTERVARLPVARRLAERVIADQPAGWEAPMLLGAARYLEWSIGRDRRLVDEAASWEAPLRTAVERAPGAAEPRRFLAAAYLETWPFLGPEKRRAAREVIAATFRDDPAGYDLLIDPWIDVAGDDALGIVPDRPDAWERLARSYASRRDWARFVAVRERHLDVLAAALEARLQEAELRLRLGDLYYGRSFLLRVIAAAPPSRRFAPLVERALAQYPPGLHGLASTAPLRAWLTWALDLALAGRPPLDPRILGRLAGAAGDLATPEAALAALVAGEIARAESLERQADRLSSEAWRPYLLAKARWHLERDEPAEAATALATIDRRRRAGALYWSLRQRAARAAGDLVALGDAERALGELAATSWTPPEWRWREDRFVAELLPARPAAGLAIELHDVGPGGAAVEVLWDGEPLATLPVASPRTIELRFPVDEGLHLLTVRTLAGAQVTPAAVSLVSDDGDAAG